MKKIEISLVMIILLSLAFFVCIVCGCNEELASNSQELLVKPPTEWIEKYGDGLESQQTANIVLVMRVINNQGEVIKQINKRLDTLEDPNGVK